MFDDAEERQLSQAVIDLAAEFPQVPHDVIQALLRQATERYATATVRAFLPILVAKDVRAALREGAVRPEIPVQAAPMPAASVLQLGTRLST
jgi:uncharacterized protein (DUF433 family)